jgi:hypothetical protein
MPDRLIQSPPGAHIRYLRCVAAKTDGIGVNRIAGGKFQHQKTADNDNQQHKNAADQTFPEKG